MRRFLLLLPLALLAVACQDQDPTAVVDGPQFAKVPKPTLTPKEALGKAIYFDLTLSLNENQACASCHEPAWGFTGPGSGVNLRGSVQEGSIPGAFGNRKPPSAAYATFSPKLHLELDGEDWIPVGGNFWDGRAHGWTLEFPSAEQALGPFLNPAEQALPHELCVLYIIADGPYAALWPQAWDGMGDVDITAQTFPKGLDKWCRGNGAQPNLDVGWDWETAYDQVGLSIKDFEASQQVNSFTSKFDGYPANLAAWTPEELRGMAIFFNEGENQEVPVGLCSACHPEPLFTDFTYDNLGIPKNPFNPVYAADPGFIDLGIGGLTADKVPAWLYADLTPLLEGLKGAVKVPTLRNVAMSPGRTVKAFGHNGVFKSLEQIVHFYNTRDDLGDPCATPPMTVDDLLAMGETCWPDPEYPYNVNKDELGKLGLSQADEAAVVAFLKTLSDGWR